LDPPLVLFCVDHNAGIAEHFRDRKHFAINVLSQSQLDLSSTFARRGVDRFDDVQWSPGTNGVPLLPGSIAVMEGEVQEIVTAGDHDIFIGRIEALDTREGEPLLFYSGRYRSVADLEELPPQKGVSDQKQSRS